MALAQHLLDNAVGWRAGIGVSVTELPRTTADPALVQYAAANSPSPTHASSGGAGVTASAARGAALGELIERTAAATANLPTRTRAELGPAARRDLDTFHLHSAEQRASTGFPFADAYAADAYAEAFDLRTNESCWLPAGLVGGLADGGLATSSGLAADQRIIRALLRATQELIERDALMLTWLHGLAPPRITAPLPAIAARAVAGVRAELTVLDLTPADCPHRVAMVIGAADLPGQPRRAAGLACRATWAEAVDKAVLEWAQAVIFTGITARDAAIARPEPAETRNFDDHARFYTLRTDLWDRLPCFAGPEGEAPRDRLGDDDAEALVALVDWARASGIELYYRELTGPDAAACGVRVVRVLSPQLAPVHHDHRWPHLDVGRIDIASRYPALASSTGFPSPYPHPLG